MCHYLPYLEIRLSCIKTFHREDKNVCVVSVPLKETFFKIWTSIQSVCCKDTPRNSRQEIEREEGGESLSVTVQIGWRL